MPLTHTQRHALLSDATLVKRVQIAVLKQAHYVLAGGTGSANPTIKAAAKYAAETYATADATKFMGYVVWNTEQGDQANITDADIEFIVASKYQEIWGA